MIATAEKDRRDIYDLLSLTGSNSNDTDSVDFENILKGDYVKIYKIFGLETAMKMYIYFRGCSISCPKQFYKIEHVATISANCESKLDRERIAVISGYTTQWINKEVRKEHR